jgi:hypothetical protein
LYLCYCQSYVPVLDTRLLIDLLRLCNLYLFIFYFIFILIFCYPNTYFLLSLWSLQHGCVRVESPLSSCQNCLVLLLFFFPPGFPLILFAIPLEWYSPSAGICKTCRPCPMQVMLFASSFFLLLLSSLFFLLFSIPNKC